jgi:hypothetical protein
MRSAAYHLSISTARGNALFASTLQRSDEPSAAQVRQAITAAIRAFGARGCAAQVAQAYGEHPETAVLRMRWVRVAVTGAFCGVRPESGPAPGRVSAASPAPAVRHDLPIMIFQLPRGDARTDVIRGGNSAQCGGDGLADIDREDVGALAGGPDELRAPLPRRCAGDEHDLAVQSGHLAPPAPQH